MAAERGIETGVAVAAKSLLATIAPFAVGGVFAGVAIYQIQDYFARHSHRYREGFSRYGTASGAPRRTDCVPLAYGRVLLPGYNVQAEAGIGSSSMLYVAAAFCQGPVNQLTTTDIYLNGQQRSSGITTDWPGNRTQTADASATKFTAGENQARRGTAWAKVSIDKSSNQFWANPQIKAIVQARKLAPIPLADGGLTVFYIYNANSGSPPATDATVAISGNTMTLTITGGQYAGSDVLTLTDANKDTLSELRSYITSTLGKGWVAQYSASLVTRMGDALSSDLDDKGATSCLLVANKADIDMTEGFTRNPAVILRDFLVNVRKETVTIDTTSFLALEEYADAVPSGHTIPRYRFDYSFDTEMSLGDMQRLICSSFHGTLVKSMNSSYATVWKVVYDHLQSSALYTFTTSNIVPGSVSWSRELVANSVRVNYLDGTAATFPESQVTVRDDDSVNDVGEKLLTQNCQYITNEEIAQRRAQFLFNRVTWCRYMVELDCISGDTTDSAADLELYDRVAVTFSATTGFNAKAFVVVGKSYNDDHTMHFILREYQNIYSDVKAPSQANTGGATLPNPWTAETCTAITLTETAAADIVEQADHSWTSTVTLTFTPPDNIFWNHVEVWLSTDDSTYVYYGNDKSGAGYVLDGAKGKFKVGDTLYVKLRSVNDNQARQDLPAAADDSEAIDQVPVAPSAPIAVEVLDTTWAGVKLAWEVVEGARYYEVWYNTVNDPNTATAMCLVTSYYEAGGFVTTGEIAPSGGFLRNTEFFFWVKAYTSAGTASDFSGSFSGTTQRYLSDGSPDMGTLVTGLIQNAANTAAFDLDGTQWWFKTSTFGNQGVQCQYNAGTPRFYAGGAGGTRFIKFDGTNLSWAGVNTSLTAGGAFTASSATITGSITATSGAIAGWTVIAGYLYKLASGTPTSSPNDGVVLASGNPGLIVYEDTAKRVEVGYLSAGVYGLKGYATDGSTVIFEMSDTQQKLAGFHFTSTTLADNATAASAKILLDAGNTLIRCGPTAGNYITIDGANLRVRSSNYVTGVAGAGFTLEPDLLEVGNIRARGMIRTAVFQKDVVSAVGGYLLVRPSDVLAGDMTIWEGPVYLLVSGAETFAVGDMLRIKDGLDDEWFEVTNSAGAPNYIVNRDMAGAYAPNTNPAWKKGATVVNYGASGEGGVLIASGATAGNAPYVRVFTHAGAPWTTQTYYSQFGNLNGVYGYAATAWGIGLGEYGAGKVNITVDSTNGIRIRLNAASLGQWDASGNITFFNTAGVGQIEIGEVMIRGSVYGISMPGCELEAWNMYLAESGANIDNAALCFYKSRDVGAGEVALVSGDYIGLIPAFGFGGTNYYVGSHVRFVADGNWSEVAYPTRISWFTRNTGALAEGLRLTSGQYVHILSGLMIGEIGTDPPKGAVGMAKLAIEGPNASAAGPHMQFTTASDDYPLMQLMNMSHDSINIAFDCYYQTGWKSSDAGSNFFISKYNDVLAIYADFGIAAGQAITNDSRLSFSSTETVFNEGGIDLDSRFETDGEASALLIDGGLNRCVMSRAQASAGSVFEIEHTGNFDAGILWDCGDLAARYTYYDYSADSLVLVYDAAPGTTWGSGTYGMKFQLAGALAGALSIDGFYGKSYAGAAVEYDAGNDLIYYESSSLRFKDNVRGWPLNLRAFLDQPVRSYDTKQEKDGATPQTSFGFIAEDFHEAGLADFLVYDEEGLPAAMRRGVVIAGHHLALQDHEGRIVELETENERLRGRVTELEAV